MIYRQTAFRISNTLPRDAARIVCVLAVLSLSVGCGSSVSSKSSSGEGSSSSEKGASSSKKGPASARPGAAIPSKGGKQAAIETARAALSSGNIQAAQTAIASHLLTRPADPLGLEIAGDIASASGELSEAIELYQSAIEQLSPASAQLYEKLGRQWMQAGAPYEAADVLRESVDRHPENGKVRADLAGLVASLGMVRDAVDHVRWLLRRGRGGLNELIMLADLNMPQTDEATCAYALKHNPDDLRPEFALSLVDVYQADFDTVARRLARVTETHPTFSVAWAYLGRALVESGDEEQLRLWQQRLPEGTDRWAEYWVAAGLWAERNDQPGAAARAFWEAIRIDDCHGEALTHLAANLTQLSMEDEAKRVAQRAAAVNAMHDSVESLLSWRRNSQQAALAIADAMSTLGRPWEAEAWARASIGMTQELDDQARETHRRLHGKLTSTTPWQIPEMSLLTSIDLSDLDPFQWDSVARDTASPSSSPTDSVVGLRFADEAAVRGLNHTCAIKKTGPEESIWIYHSNAGGAGVIDYDLDGWSDLYLTVIDGQPLQRDSGPNRLHRNVDGMFFDATEMANVGDRGFSQGVAVGDYNADGFPDLLVANIGGNRLLRNNGDGTFQDATSGVGLEGSRWTTSVAIADIDSDAIADLYEVNYAEGKKPFSQTCIDSDVKQPRSCSPLVFGAERDRVWRGRGDGTFEDVTDDWLASDVLGHGLGLVIGQIDPTPGTDIYVANDMTANHYWSSSVAEDHFSLSEQAALRGLAIDSRSRSQASMGMAIGDGDSDGDLDIFLTHFTNDHNTLYEQIKPGSWFDRTTSVGLAQPSTSMLAFGTEWIDVDNSGSPELLVANGNVDDFSHQGFPLRMPAQLFVRAKDGSWSESDRTVLGPYFQRDLVGRALVRLDLNRDGREDAVITHLFDPVAALVNQTQSESKSVRIVLKGRECSRDAIGAIVTATVVDQNRVFQLTAGDGFQCSNERCIFIGLGMAESAENVTIQWPDGKSQKIGTLQGGGDYLAVQGDSTPFNMKSHE